MIDGLHYVRKRLADGTIRHYVYAWRGGPVVYRKDGGKKPTLPAEAMERYRDAKQALAADTFEGMARKYRQSPDWNALAENTKRNWRLVLDKLVAKWGPTPNTLWSNPRIVPKIVAYRDSLSDMPRTADYHLTVLRALLKWARLQGYVTINAAADIPTLYEGGDRAEIIWTAEDRERFAAVANPAVADAVELACLTGLRLADLAGLTWADVGDHAIIRLAEKKSRGKRHRATVPLYPALRSCLSALRGRPRRKGVETVLTTSAGHAWSAGGLGKRVGDASKKASIVHHDGRKKHLHDCRGTFATELMLAGLNDNEIADILAWSPVQVATIRKVYVDGARTVVAIGERIAAGKPSVNRREPKP